MILIDMNSLYDMTLKQLNEMNDKAKRLVELMKQGIVEFIFTKKSTNQRRKAHGTLKRDLIPQEFQRKKGRPKKRPEDLVIYYDIDKGDIRSFKDYLLKSYSKKPIVQKTNIKNNDDKNEKVVKSSEKSSKQNQNKDTVSKENKLLDNKK